LEYQVVMGVKNINLDFFQDHQRLSEQSRGQERPIA